MFAQILTTILFSLAWTCISLPVILITDDEDFKNYDKPMVYVVVLGFFCYHLNNVKSFYVSILTSPIFRQNFIKAVRKLVPCCVRQQRRSENTNNSPIQRNNIEEIPLQIIQHSE
jgi:hypothetical protein